MADVVPVVVATVIASIVPAVVASNVTGGVPAALAVVGLESLLSRQQGLQTIQIQRERCVLPHFSELTGNCTLTTHRLNVNPGKGKWDKRKKQRHWISSHCLVAQLGLICTAGALVSKDKKVLCIVVGLALSSNVYYCIQYTC